MHPAHLLVLLAACTAREGGGKDGTVTTLPGDTGTGDTASPPDTSEPEDTGLSDWVKSMCPYESPPTSFTHGLVYVAFIQPDGGDFTVDYTGDVVTRELGNVDWSAHTLTLQREYMEGYTTASSTVTSSFSLQSNGDYTASTVETVVGSDGTTSEKASDVTKTGCAWVTVSDIEATGEQQTLVRELVSDDRADYTFEVTDDEGQNLTFSSWGYETSDWTEWYSFVVNDPDSAQDPDRDGTCTFTGDGTLDCAMGLYQDNGNWQTSQNTWYYDGSWDNTWETHSPDFAYDPRYWGISHGEADGSGHEEKWEIKATGSVVYCVGEWDTEGQGTMSCDDGTTWSY